MTEQIKSQNAMRGGCGRYIGIAAIALFGLVVGIAAMLVASTFLVDRAVTQPIESLKKSIGIDATPEIRPNPITIVRSINDLAQLQTASYSMEKIITAKRGEDSLFGLFEDSLIFVAVGEVTAGIDLAKLTPNDIQATSFQTATIRMPQPEIFIATLDNENSYVADRDTGLLAEADSQMETQARQAAEQAILDAAIQEGILDKADENAKVVIDGLLKSLGFQAVIFVEGDMPAVEPFDPEVPKGILEVPVSP